jgi:hypothetical protein
MRDDHDPDLSGEIVFVSRQFFTDALDTPEDFHAFLTQHFAVARQHEPSAVSLDQLPPERLLELLQRRRDRGLAKKQSVGGFGDVSLFDDDEECPKQIPIEIVDPRIAASQLEHSSSKQ